MSYSFSTGDGHWTLVPCMVAFLTEVQQCVEAGLLQVTDLGQIASPEHMLAAPVSRHNPMLAPDGNRYVCAADFGGVDDGTDFMRLADFHQAMYRAHDPRVFPHGFTQWGNGFGRAWPNGEAFWTGRDIGHCHFDVTMQHDSLGADWWVDVLASTAPWGLAHYLRTGELTPFGETQEDDMTPEQARQLEFVYNRLDATSPDAEFFVVDAGGKAKLVPRDIPGAKAVALLDTLDGNSIALTLDQVLSRLASLEASVRAVG